MTTSVGDEGGFAPKLDDTEEALDLIIESIKKSGYSPGTDVMLALDCAAAEFYKDGIYDYSIFEGEKGKKEILKNKLNI